MWFLLSSRIKALVFTLVLARAAPRIARVLRGYGHRQQRSGGGTLTTTVPLTAADALDKLAAWARPQKSRRRRFF
nr:phosphodiesterase [uncultured bacterium]